MILWSSILHAAFYFYTSFALLRYMFVDRFVTTDELWATGATFTVVAWAFAYTFMAVQVIWPGSFSATIHRRLPGRGSRCCSCRSRTSPASACPTSRRSSSARSWVMIEQVAGLLYVALVISRVVGLTIARQRTAHTAHVAGDEPGKQAMPGTRS